MHAFSQVRGGGLARDTARPNQGTPMSGGTIILVVSACVLAIVMSSLYHKRSQPGDQGNPESGSPPPWYGGGSGGSDSDGDDGD